MRHGSDCRIRAVYENRPQTVASDQRPERVEGDEETFRRSNPRTIRRK